MKNPRRMPACGSHVVISGGFNETVITFFKCGSTEQMLKKLRPVIALLDKYKKPYDIVYTNFVGTIVLFYNLYSIWTSKGSAAASPSLTSSAGVHPSARYAACDSFEE